MSTELVFTYFKMGVQTWHMSVDNRMKKMYPTKHQNIADTFSDEISYENLLPTVKKVKKNFYQWDTVSVFGQILS